MRNPLCTGKPIVKHKQRIYRNRKFLKYKENALPTYDIFIASLYADSAINI